MGFPCASIRMPRPIGIVIVLKVLHCIDFISRALSKQSSMDSPDHQGHVLDGRSLYVVPTEQTPSASPVPAIRSPSTALKDLSVVEFGTFLERLNREQDRDGVCLICLDGIDRSHEIRELSNCTHAFHRECLDSWVREGHATCPLCRAVLFSSPEGTLWRQDPSTINRNYYSFHVS